MTSKNIRFDIRSRLCLALAVAFVLASGMVRAQSLGAYADLHDFAGTVTNANGASGSDGANPYSRVTFDSAGNVYGTASAGGAYQSGMVWEITGSGAYKDLHDFGGTLTNAGGASGPDGSNPTAGVTFDSSGNMYGTAEYGGPNSGGSTGGMVWEITASGTYKDLHDFGGTATNAGGSSGPDGSYPYAGVTFDRAGNMYGSTSSGGPNATGSNQGGMLWEITTSGAYVDLHDFGGTVTNAKGTTGPDGSGPTGVTFDGAGNMYGTAYGGGGIYDSTNKLYDYGMVWEIKTSGTYVDLHDFGGTVTNANGTTGPDGNGPSGVAFDSAGNMYGTAYFGGGVYDSFNRNNDFGMVWEITQSGAYKDLHDFGGNVTNANGTNGPDGTEPYEGVTLDNAGNIYGTAEFGGGIYDAASKGYDFGMVWEIPASGTYLDLHDFGGTVTNANGTSGPDGNDSTAAVTVDGAGNIYGTTNLGGPNDLTNGGAGIVWKIAPAVAVFGAGLQMISLPYAYPGISLDTLFGYSGVKLAVWDQANDAYALTPTPPANEIDLGQAYWVRFPQAVGVGTAGTPAPANVPFDIPLQAGWNMVGDPFTTAVPVSSLTFNSGTETFTQATTSATPLIGRTVWTYNAQAKAYVAATSLNPDVGYWVFAYSATDMDISQE